MACILSTTDIALFAASAISWLGFSKASSGVGSDSCEALKNSAFVFVKPHANTPAVQKLVREKLIESGISILSEADISGDEIDKKKLIDQHYYAIASKATILDAKDIPVPADKFEKAFGESWEKVLKEDRACNAMEACKRYNVDGKGLEAIWSAAKQVEKFGGGFYCGKLNKDGKELYVFNAFFMSMRSKFVGDASIHCYEVEWEQKKLSWSDFRGKVLGPTDPSEAPEGSLRKTILGKWKDLGLKAEPNKGDNGVHASASPFEGLAEKVNWLGKSIDKEPFGKALMNAGLSLKTIVDWSVDPRVNVPGGGQGSVFDSLEDMDVSDCLKKLVELNGLN